MGLFFKDEESWLDRVLRGEDVCSGFYGRRGEFSRNDEAYRVSDDIRQCNKQTFFVLFFVKLFVHFSGQFRGSFVPVYS